MNNGFDLTCQAFYYLQRYNKVMVRVDIEGDKARVRCLKRILDGGLRGMWKA